MPNSPYRKSISHIHVLLPVLIIFIVQTSCYAEKVKWLQTISGQNEQISLGDKLFKFVFGENKFSLIRPVSITLKNDDMLWILDQGLQSVALFDMTDPKIKKFNSDPVTSFPSPVSISAGPGDTFYFTDSIMEKVFVFESKGRGLRVLADGYSMQKPTGIAWHPVLNKIYICETGNHRILILDHSGKIEDIIGSRGTGNGQFNFPTFLWIDDEGLLYIVDSMNFRVQIFSAAGEFRSVFGKPGNSSGYLARPKGIATDSDGNIYVVDALFHTVQIFDREGHYLYHFGKQGKGDAEFWLPSGIFIDSEDRIFIADSYNSRIQIFQYIREE